jgi:hypothetical protein
MTFESTQSFKTPIPNDPRNRSYTVKVLDDGVTIITQQEMTGSQTSTQVMGRIAKGQTSFIPEKVGNQTLPNQEQIKYFTENSREIVKNYSVPTVLQGTGGSAGGGYAKVNEILGTNVSPPPTLPSSSGTAEFNSEALSQLNENSIPGKPPKNNYGNLRYPFVSEGTEDIKMDVVKFTMKSYKTRRFRADIFGFEKRNEGTTLGTTSIGIQPSISDSNIVSWNGLEMSFGEMMASDAALSIMMKGGVGVKESIEKAIETLNLGPEVQSALLNLLTQQAAGTKGLLPRLTGAISNPNLELLFQGPQLRTFNYNFKLSPRNKRESREVIKIINFFKRGMSVQRTNSDLFLKAPNVFDIQYRYADTNADHKGLNRIKTCALLNCAVDYTPTGSYMTFNDNETQSMVSYNLSLTFQELEPVYEDEYKDGEIGY